MGTELLLFRLTASHCLFLVKPKLEDRVDGTSHQNIKHALNDQNDQNCYHTSVRSSSEVKKAVTWLSRCVYNAATTYVCVCVYVFLCPYNSWLSSFQNASTFPVKCLMLYIFSQQKQTFRFKISSPPKQWEQKSWLKQQNEGWSLFGRQRLRQALA